MSDIDNQNINTPSKLMHYWMMICCAVMFLPVAAFLLAGGSIAEIWSNVGLFAPILLCVGAHVAMFKVMGKSCHGSKDEKPRANTVDAESGKVRVSAQGFDQ